MDKFVACLYIQDYRKKIAAEADEAQRQKLLSMTRKFAAKTEQPRCVPSVKGRGIDPSMNYSVKPWRCPVQQT
jgi:hypothetical protein